MNPHTPPPLRAPRNLPASAAYDPAVAAIDISDGAMPVAFVGTYGPRRCGIATFTADLARAVAGDGRVSPVVLAVTDPGGQYQYSADVKFEIRQNVKADYARAAEFVNYSSVRLVCIQHEYGIFGGDDGGYLLDFVYALRVPAVVTLHTVLKRPSENQAAIVRKMWERCEQLIVMSQIARDLLATSYGVSGSKVRIIPHGIPVLARGTDRQVLKAEFGVAARRLLLTFGLLSRNKGIETVIRALPAVVRRFPDVMYFVVGATHPVIIRREGEAYRTLLEREAEKLGVRDHVAFRGQFVADEELHRYLLAADVFISPYLNEAQVTSGALSYAMGAGAAVVSTPYWHAQELLADGRGRLFPFNDHEALSRTLLELFSSPAELERTRDAAFALAREMAWPEVGGAYYEIMRSAVRMAEQEPAAHPAAQPLAVSSLPDLSLDHLLRMTDDTGIIQHAVYSVPARSTGYCVDDNARALIVAVRADRIQAGAQTRMLVTRYLSYLHGSQRPDGSFCNFMSYERVLDSAPASDDCIGRAIWALGVTASMAADEGCRTLAREMLTRALPHTGNLGPRGGAQVVLGLVMVLAVEPGAVEERRLLDGLVAKLLDAYRANATDDWRWFESTLTYDNAILPLALFAAYSVTGERATLHHARASLEFLEEVCFHGDQVRLVGNTGWHSVGGEKARADEQAIDATALVLALSCAYSVTKDRHYLVRMHEAFAWFLGSNRLG
ncbi:MAG TPA: glycosyltransferase family 4 protein, partial [Gammaproteobacteria bacterium]|nr:glycosyltransferase family 4 protein [Gammaproteobacteria bacterium]